MTHKLQLLLLVTLSLKRCQPNLRHKLQQQQEEEDEEQQQEEIRRRTATRTR